MRPQAHHGLFPEEDSLNAALVKPRPVSPLREVEQVGCETVPTQVAHAPRPHLAFHRRRMDMPQEAVDAVAELAAAGVARAMGADEHLPNVPALLAVRVWDGCWLLTAGFVAIARSP